MKLRESPRPTGAILDVNGRPYPKAPAAGSRVVRRSSMDTYSTHPAAGLTADMLLGYYRMAERGDPARQFDCFEDLIGVDGHARGLYQGRIELTSGCDWTLQAGAQDEPSKFAAKELEARMRGGLGFRAFLKHQLKAPFLGFSSTNIVWDYVDGMIAPVDFINVAHRRFAAPSQERADEIMLINYDEHGRAFLEALAPGSWATLRYERNPFAAGLLRTAAWWVMFKRWSIRDWQVFAEMFGLPLAIGFYQEGAGPQSREALEEAVRMIGEDGYAILSDLCDLVIKDAARSGDSSTVYPEIADRCDAELSKLITGGTANTDIGNKGSYAAGEIHADRAYALTKADAKDVDEMFTRDIGAWFVAYNQIAGASPPRLKVQITRDNADRAIVISTLGQAIDIDEDQIREEFSLRTPPKGKGVRWPTKAPAVPLPPSGGGKDGRLPTNDPREAS